VEEERLKKKAWKRGEVGRAKRLWEAPASAVKTRGEWRRSTQRPVRERACFRRRQSGCGSSPVSRKGSPGYSSDVHNAKRKERAREVAEGLSYLRRVSAAADGESSTVKGQTRQGRQEPSVGQFQVFVQTPSGKSVTVNVDSAADIRDVGASVENKCGTPKTQQVLTYAGKRLQEGRSLADYAIGNGATLALAMRLLGGPGEEEEVPERFVLDEAAAVLVACRDAFPLGYLEFSLAQKYVLVLLAQHRCTVRQLSAFFGRYGDPDRDWQPVTAPSTSTMSACKARSIRGIGWALGGKRGRHPYMNADERHAFKVFVLARESSPPDVIELQVYIGDAKAEALVRARHVAALIGAGGQVAKEALDIERGTKTVRKLTEDAGLVWRQPEAIEPLRALFPTRTAMVRWFAMVGPQIQHIPDRLRFNGDEMMLANGKHRKVAVSSEAHPFYKATKKLPHHTLMTCFNRFAQGPVQWLVLPGLRNVPPEVKELDEPAS
jgi:hypothetical protein